MKNTPYVLIATALVGLIALLALPWVTGDSSSPSLLDIIKHKDHGYQIAYVIMAPLVIALIVGGVSVRQSRRWQTGIVAFVLIIPTGLAALARDAASGAHVAALCAGVALISALVLTVKPNRQIA